MKLMAFQKKFLLDVYDNPRAITSRAYLSMPRKNGKSALIACMVLAHTLGPLKKRNSQIISGARSRDQASLVFKLAVKMINLHPRLADKTVSHVTPSTKTITGLLDNVEYKAISAEAGTAHGLSPVVAILDEVGQVKGDYDAFVEAIETSQGAYEDEALLIAISTQAPTDGDLFSKWIDDAMSSDDPRIVCHLYTAPEGCDIMDKEAWRVSNPALGEFRSYTELEAFAENAARLPSKENSFRWLYLNQRIDATAPFVSPSIWKENGSEPIQSFKGFPVFCGLDLSETADLSAFVAVAPTPLAPSETGPEELNWLWNVKPVFWLPKQGLREKSRTDRVQWDVWEREGYLKTTPGPTVDYAFVAAYLWDFCQVNNVRKIGFDRWNWRHFKPWLVKVGFSDVQVGVDGVNSDRALFQKFGQGYESMSPALRTLEEDLLNRRMAHGNHPVLTMNAANATIVSDEAGNRKLTKKKSHGRIDGMVALAMARSVAGTFVQPKKRKYQMVVM
jgi:phage terminase large subunit-like protein